MSADRQIPDFPPDFGLVTIRRKKGRIAGFAAPSCPVDILWCGTNRPRKKHGRRANGWSFPPAVRELLLQETQGKTVLHLFGGLADFGARLDMDPETKPDVLGDAFLAHKLFPRNSFDDVVLDPPYSICRKDETRNLIETSAWIARRYVWWFHTVSIATHRVTPLDRMWLVFCGDQCSMRTLQRFKVLEPKRRPPQFGDFKRGPAVKYNRWARVAAGLPFPGVEYPPGVQQ